MGLLEHVVLKVVGGNAGGQSGTGANPLVIALTSLLTSDKPVEPSQQPGAGRLDALVARFDRHGHRPAIESWIGHGPNQTLLPHEFGAALGPETLIDLSRQTGIDGPDLLSQLSRMLPGIVHRLTPNGRVPTAPEHAHW